MHASHHLSHRLTGAAALFQRASVAIVFAGAVEPHVGFGDAAALALVGAMKLQQSFSVWTGKAVGCCVVGKIRSAKGPVFAIAFVPYRYVRLDVLFFDHPTQHFRRSVSGVANQTLRLHAEALLDAMDIGVLLAEPLPDDVRTLLAATGRLRDGKELDIPGPAFLRNLLMNKLDKTQIGGLLREFKLVQDD